VNDNIPVFTEVVSGSVLENEPAGTAVMQVRAIDADSSIANNRVTYELADNREYFTIDPYTGNITTLVMFDREKQDVYNVKVIATDNAPSALYSTGEHNKGEYKGAEEDFSKINAKLVYNKLSVTRLIAYVGEWEEGALA
jgi:hypothetical protein